MVNRPRTSPIQRCFHGQRLSPKDVARCLTRVAHAPTSLPPACRSLEVNGQEALELSQSDNGTTIDIWVDPTTYLPLKSVWTLGWRVQTSLISWLQPTDANMAVFSPPVPAGFTLIPEPTAPAGCPGTPGGQPSGTPPRLSPACKAALAGNTGSAAGNTGSTSSSGS